MYVYARVSVSASGCATMQTEAACRNCHGCSACVTKQKQTKQNQHKTTQKQPKPTITQQTKTHKQTRPQNKPQKHTQQSQKHTQKTKQTQPLQF